MPKHDYMSLRGQHIINQTRRKYYSVIRNYDLPSIELFSWHTGCFYWMLEQCEGTDRSWTVPPRDKHLSCLFSYCESKLANTSTWGPSGKPAKFVLNFHGASTWVGPDGLMVGSWWGPYRVHTVTFPTVTCQSDLSVKTSSHSLCALMEVIGAVFSVSVVSGKIPSLSLCSPCGKRHTYTYVIRIWKCGRAEPLF